ncbi:MAG: hypothetical protein H0V82_12925 [Candidatus Protochlamydia sp.]|nr:hypothetical protein [Candidatus Protochlamydia sp.]
MPHENEFEMLAIHTRAVEIIKKQSAKQLKYFLNKQPAENFKKFSCEKNSPILLCASLFDKKCNLNKFNIPLDIVKLILSKSYKREFDLNNFKAFQYCYSKDLEDLLDINKRKNLTIQVDEMNDIL